MTTEKVSKQAPKTTAAASKKPAPVARESSVRSEQQIQQALAEPHIASASSLLNVQRLAGNRAANRLMTKPASAQRESAGGSAGGEVTPELQQQIEQARGGGSQLDAKIGAKAGQALGADFSGVRVHTDSSSDTLNRSLNAKAFTLGPDIFFSQNAYQPGSASGDQLIAHELTHVAQQGQAKPNKAQRKLTVGAADDGFEQEADRTAEQITHYKPEEEMTSPAPQRVNRTFQAQRTIQRFSFKNLFRRKKRSNITHMGGGRMTSGEQGNVPSARDIELFYESSRRRQETEGPGIWHDDPEEMDRALQEQRETDTIGGLQESGYNTEPTPEGPNPHPNIPLTGADLKNARRLIYDAALQALAEIPGDEATQPKIDQLRTDLTRERTLANIRDSESLLVRLMQGDKEALKAIVSKDLLDQLAVRIAEATGQDAHEVEAKAHAKFVALINNSPSWQPFAKDIDIGGQSFSSTFTPINQSFDQSFSRYGQSGYASMTAHMPVTDQMPLEQRTRATNAWYTQFRSGDSVTGDILFEAFRSGSFSEKGVKDSKKRRALAQMKAYDLLKAMAIQYLKSRDPSDQQAILSGAQVPTVTVVSTSLLTSFMGKLDHKLLKDHADAFESFHGKKTAFDISFGGQNRSLMVRFNVINFNKAVNEFRWMGASRSGQQLKMNKEGIKRLRAFKVEGLRLLEEKFNNNQAKIGGLMTLAEGEDAETLRGQNAKLAIQIAKVKQLWARIETVTARKGRLFSGSGSGYELPALASNLGYQLGAMVHYNCMSGKDRTGMADVESKLLAYQMDQRVQEAQESGVSLDNANLVPDYSGPMSEGDAEAATRLMFESGNLDVQQMNTGVAGYKIRGAMMSRFGGGRMGRIMGTQKGQQVMRGYLGVDQQISLKAKVFSKLVNALSIFTGA